MKRAALVSAGTLAGIAALVAFNPEAGASSTTSSAVTSTPSDTSSTAATPTASATAAASEDPSTSDTPSTDTSGTSPSSDTSSSSGTSTSANTAAGTATNGTYTGDLVDVGHNYGSIQVVVTVADGKVSAVTTTAVPQNDPRSSQISQQAVPMLVDQAISAQSSSISGVSGATFTSNGFAQSLASALTQAGLT